MNPALTDARWIRSRACSAAGCVEIAHLSGGMVAIRDSKDLSKAPHLFDSEEWAAFVTGVRNGDFDSPAG
jgi:hypothetical protein